METVNRRPPPGSRPSQLVKSDNYGCLGRVPYGIFRYSTRYVRHGTITQIGTVQQTPGRYKVGTVQKSGRYMIQLVQYHPVVGWLCVGFTDTKKKHFSIFNLQTDFFTPFLIGESFLKIRKAMIQHDQNSKDVLTRNPPGIFF